MTEKPPLLCRIGWHTSTCYDSAMFNGADRCNKCGEWVDKAKGAQVDRERARWAQMDDPDAALSALLRKEESDE